MSSKYNTIANAQQKKLVTKIYMVYNLNILETREQAIKIIQITADINKKELMDPRLIVGKST